MHLLRLLILPALLASACTSRAIGDGNPSGGDPTPLSDEHCTVPIDSICTAKGCNVFGLQHPATLAAWCAEDPLVRKYSEVVPGNTSGCMGLTMVSVLVGDQGHQLYYDASGQLVAAFAWTSAAPCHGACTLVCVAGPPDLSPSQLGACSSHASPGFDWCEPDGGTSD